MMACLIVIVSMVVVIGSVLAYLLDVKLDWTEDRELLLWYNEYPSQSWDGTSQTERKFIKILKL